MTSNYSIIEMLSYQAPMHKNVLTDLYIAILSLYLITCMLSITQAAGLHCSALHYCRRGATLITNHDSCDLVLWQESAGSLAQYRSPPDKALDYIISGSYQLRGQLVTAHDGLWRFRQKCAWWKCWRMNTFGPIKFSGATAGGSLHEVSGCDWFQMRKTRPCHGVYILCHHNILCM